MACLRQHHLYRLAAAYASPDGFDEAVSTNDNTPTFAWTTVAGASHYLLQLDTMASFNTFHLREVTVEGGTTSHTIVSPLADSTWYWRVAANDSEGNLGAFSAPRSLYVHASPPSWDQPLTNHLLKLGSPFRYDVNASDPVGIDHYWINDTTHFAIDTVGIITNPTSLLTGRYGIEVRAYDAYLNYCSATFKVTVQAEMTTTTITPPPILGFPWPAIFMACAGALSLSLYRRRRPRH